MDEKTVVSVMFWFTVTYLTLFSIISSIEGNYEFLYYTCVIAVFMFVILFYYHQLHLTKTIIFSLTLLGVLHIAGGNIHIAGTRLYDIWLITGIFKYDNLVHAFGIAIATLVAYNILLPKMENSTKYRPFAFSLMLVLIAMGIGALNEVVEFFAVIFLGAAKGVGDYFNNTVDLVYNLLGSTLVSVFLYYHHKKHHAPKKNN
jgi:uncharacterized membrane protein YjdF